MTLRHLAGAVLLALSALSSGCWHSCGGGTATTRNSCPPPCCPPAGSIATPPPPPGYAPPVSNFPAYR